MKRSHPIGVPHFRRGEGACAEDWELWVWMPAAIGAAPVHVKIAHLSWRYSDTKFTHRAWTARASAVGPVPAFVRQGQTRQEAAEALVRALYWHHAKEEDVPAWLARAYEWTQESV